MTIVVSDTSPIRAPSHLGLLDVLPTLFGDVRVPPAVERELTAVGVTLPGGPAFRTVAPENLKLVARLVTGLDPGESEAIALAVELDADLLLIDEAKGRAVARSLGLSSRGALGVLLSAKSAGLITSIHPLIARLTGELNFFLSARLIAEVLNLAGEAGDGHS
jgi:predicted nucleic acid-binding protein